LDGWVPDCRTTTGMERCEPNNRACVVSCCKPCNLSHRLSRMPPFSPVQAPTTPPLAPYRYTTNRRAKGLRNRQIGQGRTISAFQALETMDGTARKGNGTHSASPLQQPLPQNQKPRNHAHPAIGSKASPRSAGRRQGCIRPSHTMEPENLGYVNVQYVWMLLEPRVARPLSWPNKCGLHPPI
jgi:hypothetical protein